jgi:hypothetical protein
VKGPLSVMSEPSETPEQRRARYVRLSAEAETAAGQCRGSALREAYLALARSWALLAKDVKLDDEV